jgi:hypothetical protein
MLLGNFLAVIAFRFERSYVMLHKKTNNQEDPDRGDQTCNLKHSASSVESGALRSQREDLEDSELPSSLKSTAPFWIVDLRFWIENQALSFDYRGLKLGKLRKRQSKLTKVPKIQ